MFGTKTHFQDYIILHYHYIIIILSLSINYLGTLAITLILFKITLDDIDRLAAISM